MARRSTSGPFFLMRERSLRLDADRCLIEGIHADDLLNEFGSPLFVVSERILHERFDELAENLARAYPRSRIAYSFKTNYIPGICALFKEQGALAEVVSGFEYFLAKQLGYRGAEIVFNGPLKRDEELVSAAEEGAMLNIDNYAELARLHKVLEARSQRATVGIRVYSRASAAGQVWNRFGFAIEDGEAMRVLERIQRSAPQIEVRGVSAHLGTNISDIETYRAAFRTVAEFVARAKERGITVKYVDAGGGFAVPGNDPREETGRVIPAIGEYVDAIASPLKEKLGGEPLLVLEPGRFLVTEGVILLSKVIASRQYDQGSVTLDASISFLREASFLDLKIEALKGGEPKFLTTLLGASCTQHDVLGKALLPEVREGEPLVFRAVGAYSIARSSQWIHPRPAVVLIPTDRKSPVLLRRREEYGDMLRLDRFGNKHWG